MPKSKYITQTPQDFGEALKISGFSIKNEITDTLLAIASK